MKNKLKAGLIVIFAVTTFSFSACAGPGNVSVGVGVGVGRPYGAPPAGGTIWIGRPMPQTIYNTIPPASEIRYVHDQIVPAIDYTVQSKY